MTVEAKGQAGILYRCMLPNGQQIGAMDPSFQTGTCGMCGGGGGYRPERKEGGSEEGAGSYF
jgi:hypothetical protein